MKYLMSLPQDVLFIMKTLENAHFECFLVGGSTRDALLGKTPHDYDFTTNATPDEIKAVFAGHHLEEMGIKHGTITLFLNHEPYEITTYRKETTYEDHRHPDDVIFTSSLEEDLARRDFTINAFAYSPKHGLVDLFSGQKDLKNRLVRCVGNPQKRFEEDALRILRALRFSSVLDFDIEPETKQAILNLYPTLEYISKERIHEEFVKLLKGPRCERILLEYTQVFQFLFEGFGFHDSKENLTQTCSILANFKERPITKLSYLAKEEPSESFSKALITYRFSSEDRELLEFLKTHIKEAFPQDDVEILLRLHRYEVSSWMQLLLFHYDITQKSDWLDVYKRTETLLQENWPYRIKDLALNGTDCLALGVVPREIGALLEKLLLKVIRQELPNDKKALQAYIQSTQTRTI